VARDYVPDHAVRVVYEIEPNLPGRLPVRLHVEGNRWRAAAVTVRRGWTYDAKATWQPHRVPGAQAQPSKSSSTKMLAKSDAGGGQARVSSYDPAATDHSRPARPAMDLYLLSAGAW